MKKTITNVMVAGTLMALVLGLSGCGTTKVISDPVNKVEVGSDDEVDWNEIKEIIFENGWDWYNDVDEVPEKMIDQMKDQYQKWQKEVNDGFEEELAKATGEYREFLLKVKNGEYRK